MDKLFNDVKQHKLELNNRIIKPTVEVKIAEVTKVVIENKPVVKAPSVVQPPTPAPVQRVEDLTHLISSTVVALKKYDFKLSDFSMKNIE